MNKNLITNLLKLDEQLHQIKEAGIALDTISRLPLNNEGSQQFLSSITIEGFVTTLQLVTEKLDRCHKDAMALLTESLDLAKTVP